jgi:Flp pilus assembly pilin Flp
MERINRLIRQFVADDKGQDLIEYALLAGLVGCVGAALFPIMQGRLKPLFTGWENAVFDLWIPKPHS